MVSQLNPEKMFENMKAKTAEAVKNIYNIQGKKRTLRVDSVEIHDDKDPFNFPEQRDVKDKGGTWSIPVKATISLLDNATGTVLHTAKVKVTDLPKVTGRFSYLVDGDEYQVQHQFRRLPGVYTRIGENGEMQAVVGGGWQSQLKMNFEPASRKIELAVAPGTSSTVSVIPILHGVGMSESELHKAFGKEIVEANMTDKDLKGILSAATKVSGAPVTNPKAAAKILADHYNVWKLNPEVTEDTIGVKKSTFDTEVMKTAATKLVGISKGEVSPSTYDNVGHKEFLDAGDILYDLINRKKRILQAKIKFNLDKSYEVTDAVKAQPLAKVVHGFFKSGETQLAARADQTNPIAMISGATQTTVMGMGGISGSVGNSLNTAQLVHGSHIGFLDPLDTGEKKDSGLILPLPITAGKQGNTIVATMYNTKTKKMEEVPVLKAYKSVVAFPDDIKYENGVVTPRSALVSASVSGGAIEKVPFSKVDYVIVSATHQFGVPSNLVPFLANNNGNRAMMAGKMGRQAISLIHREAPLVQIKTESGDTFESALGKFFSHTAKESGVVTKVTANSIDIKASDGKIHQTHLYDRFQTTEKKTSLTSEPLVKVGDVVKKGQVVADQNFTKNGVLSLGKNLTIGYMPMKGYNFEDGVVISRSATEKLTSQHTTPMEMEVTLNVGTVVSNTKDLDSLDIGAVVASKSLYLAWAPQSAKAVNLSNIGEDGVIKEGATVHPGDVLVAAIQKSKQDLDLAGMRGSNKFKNPWKAKDLRWDHDNVGVVSRVVKNGKYITVFVTTKEAMNLGDKLVGRYGNKGVVTQILEDKDMPHTIEGGVKKPIDVLMNPAGIPGRINPGQVLELAAGKIAKKTGKTYEIKNFDSSVPDMMEKLQKELKSHGLTDTETVYDPTTGKSLGNVLVGPQYIQKLVHQGEKKLSGRSGGSPIIGAGKHRYDQNLQPAHGGTASGQALSTLGVYALLGHNARANIQELQTHKSTYERPNIGERGYDSDDFWSSLMSGTPLPPASPTFAYNKFMGYLKAMGINTVKEGHEIRLMPYTDDEILKTAKHEIKDPGKMLVGTSGEADKGGLFDFPDGKINSKKWGHIKLAEPMPNPIFQTPIEVLLGLKKGELDSVMAGERKIDGEVGGIAVKAALGRINVKADLAKLKNAVAKMPAAEKDKAHKKIKLLSALDRMGLSPTEAYINHYMPVLPPIYRPVGLSASSGSLGSIESADANQLYKLAGLANNELKSFDPAGLPENKNKLRANLYETIKNTYLTGVATTRGVHISSIMQTVAKPNGGQSKEGMYQEKIIKRRSDLSGRAVIIPEPQLKLDEVGLPRKMAQEIYKPFIVREMKGMGYNPLEAIKKLTEEPNHPSVKLALDKAVAIRPVFIKRDPVLHKFGVMAFNPVIHEGKAIQIHPLVCGGFNADFDGDSMAVFVPSSDKAVAETKNMMPSKNLFSSTNYKLMNLPGAEAAYGIFQVSTLGKDSGKKFNSVNEILAAEKAGVIGITDRVSLSGNNTSAGRALLFNALPESIRSGQIGQDVLFGDPIGKGKMQSILVAAAKDHQEEYSHIMDAWKNIGNLKATALGSSLSLKDFSAYKDIREKHLAVADAALSKLKVVKPEDKVREYGKAYVAILAETEAAAKRDNNKLYNWTQGSGALSKWGQVTQMISAPLQVMDGMGGVSPNPVRKSYSEGLTTADYWNSIPGVRSGTLARAKETQDPGARAKGIMNLVVNLPIATDDCKTHKGIMIDTTNPDAEGRYLAEDVGSFKYDDVVTPSVLAELKKTHKQIKVRSSLTCALKEGICQKCAGINENGKLHEKGVNFGVLAGEALSEPLTQMIMKAFHCLHRHSLVHIKNSEGVFCYTLEDLFQEIPTTPFVEDSEEIKKVPSGWFVYDSKQWSPLTHVRRHLPDSPMKVLSSGGLLTICQDTHPIGISEDTFMSPREMSGSERLLKDLTCTTQESKEASLGVDPYLVGSYLAEGCVVWKKSHKKQKEKKPYAVYISQKDGSIKDKMLQAMQTIGHPKVTHKGMTVNSPVMGQLFNDLFGRYSRNKKLPKNFLSYSREYLSSVLSGMIDGDGCIVHTDSGAAYAQIDTTSFALLQQMSMISSKLGIGFYCVATPKRKHSLHQGYQIRIKLSESACSILGESIKVKSVGTYGDFSPLETVGWNKVGIIKDVMHSELDFVYDATTESHVLVASGIYHHNTGGSAMGGGDATASHFDQANQIFEMVKPESMPVKATLSTENGKVTKIVEDRAAGGHFIFINGVPHRVPTNLKILVSVGDEVKKGQSISTGPVSPHELLKHTNMEHTRNHLVSALGSIYKSYGVRQRNVEAVIRNLTNTVEITEDPLHIHSPKDILAETTVEKENQERAELKEPLIEYKHVIKGIDEAIKAVHGDDWLARMNYQELERTLKDGVALGAKSNIHSSNPIAGIAYGAEFGQSKGDSWKY